MSELKGNPFYFDEMMRHNEIVDKGIESYFMSKCQDINGADFNDTFMKKFSFLGSEVSEVTQDYFKTLAKIKEISFSEKKATLRNNKTDELVDRLRGKSFIDMFEEMFMKRWFYIEPPKQENPTPNGGDGSSSGNGNGDNSESQDNDSGSSGTEQKNPLESIIEQRKEELKEAFVESKERGYGSVEGETGVGHTAKKQKYNKSLEQLMKYIDSFVSSGIKAYKKSYKGENNVCSLLPKRMRLNQATYPSIVIDNSGSMDSCSYAICDIIQQILKKKRLLGKVKTFKCGSEFVEFDIRDKDQWADGNGGWEAFSKGVDIMNKQQSVLVIGDGFWEEARELEKVKVPVDIIFMGDCNINIMNYDYDYSYEDERYFLNDFMTKRNISLKQVDL